MEKIKELTENLFTKLQIKIKQIDKLYELNDPAILFLEKEIIIIKQALEALKIVKDLYPVESK